MGNAAKASAIQARNSSLIVTRDAQTLTVVIRRPFWLALRVLSSVALATATLPATIAFAMLVAIICHWAIGETWVEYEMLAPFVVALLLGVVALPLILWFGFTKTTIPIGERWLVVRHAGLATRRRLRWPNHLVGGIGTDRHGVAFFSADGRVLAKVMPFWRWEEALLIGLLNSTLRRGTSAELQTARDPVSRR